MFDDYGTYHINNPSFYITEAMESRSWSAEDLAARSELSLDVINQIIIGDQYITLDLAKALGKGFGINHEVFVGLQGSYDLDQYKQAQMLFDGNLLDEGIKINHFGVYIDMPKERKNHIKIRINLLKEKQQQGEKMRTIIKTILAGLMFINIGYCADFNIRVSPKALFGFLNARIDYKVAEHISVGGIFDYAINYLDYHTVGGGVNIKLDGQDIMRHDGWLVNPYITYSFGKFDKNDGVLDMSSTTIAGVLVKQWIWNNGFNMRFGGGFQYNTIKYLGYRAFPFITFTLGFIF